MVALTISLWPSSLLYSPLMSTRSSMSFRNSCSSSTSFSSATLFLVIFQSTSMAPPAPFRSQKPLRYSVYIWHLIVMEQPFNNYFLFCHCLLLLFGFVDDIIKGQQHESDFISFYLCLSLFGYLLSPISYLLSPYLLISGSYPIGGYLDHILLVDKSWLV